MEISNRHPYLKPGKPADQSSSYRPISLLSLLGKLLERHILTRLTSFMDENNIIPIEQFGFKKGHSTSLQVLRIVKNVRTKLREGQSTGMITLDIEKAFDRVWHKGLLFKMIKLEFPHHLIKTIASFLSNRTFRVAIGTNKSDEFPVPYGVPQGSVLAPSLYNLYTSDIPKIVDCQYSIFADDTALGTSSKFYKRIKRRLEKASRILNRYFNKWKISLNNQKTEAIFFTRRLRKQKPPPGATIKIVNQYIPWKSSLKYLGCLLDTRMTLKLHLQHTIAQSVKALKSIYPLIHRRSVLNTRIKVNIFKSYIRPVLTYPSIVINKASKTNIKKIQRQQNKLLKMIDNKPRDHPTADLHKSLKVPLIEDFLERLDLRAEIKAEISSNPLVQNIYT